MKTYLDHFRNHRSITLVGPCEFGSVSARMSDPVIFVDGGVRHRVAGEGHSVGDGDSARAPLDTQLPVDKDFSDLAFALAQIPDTFTEVALIGFLGGRRDHEIMNLMEVHRFLKQRRVATTAWFDQGQVEAFSAGEWVRKIDGRFSLVAFEAAQLTLSGACQYHFGPGKFEALTSLGLSNQGHGSVTVQTSGPVFLLR